MLFRLVNYTVLGIAAFYAVEGVGLVERGKYFPTLPRLEASASDPMAWVGAAQWGVAQLTNLAGQHEVTQPIASSISDPTQLTLDNVTTFAKRLEAKRNQTLQGYGINTGINPGS